MLPVFVIAIVFWLSSIYVNLVSGFDTIGQTYELRSKELDMVTIAEAMEMYYQEKGVMPADLPTLATTPGYEYVGSHLNSWQSYAISGNLVDDTWTFIRAAAITFDRSDGTTADSYFAQNSCGTGSFSTDTSGWCGTPNSRWYAVESRKYFEPQMSTERIKLGRLSMKFADYFNSNGGYPAVDNANNALAAESIISIASLVGYTGSARTCSGQFQYQGIPIDCSDMFDVWGGTVGYQFESASHVIFVSEPPIFNSSGARVVVAVDRA